MKIAIVAPLFEHIPPTKYGGTERIIHYLVEQLVALGHSVTLYATDGSQTSAKLVPCYSGTLREHGIGSKPEDTERIYTAQVKLACSAVPAHDIVHIHHGLYPYHPALLETITNIPFVWTDHNAVHNDGKPEIIDRLLRLGIKLTALSDSHRNTVPLAPWTATIHHGLPVNLLNAKPADPSYLAFLGRISPEKGICDAIWIANRAKIQLKIAAKVDAVDRLFYEKDVKPLLEQLDAEYIGEVTEDEKGPFLSAAKALIFPICWEEPFGLVMIEAMACGCPVIAFKRGSVPEIIEDGVTGFIVETREEACEAIQKLPQLDRQYIRKRFEERFVSTLMAEKYVEAYKASIEAFKNTHNPLALAGLRPSLQSRRSTAASALIHQVSMKDSVNNKVYEKPLTAYTARII